MDARWAHYTPQYLRSLIQFSLNCVKIGHSLLLNSGVSTIKLLSKIVVILGYEILISKFTRVCKFCEFLLLMIKNYVRMTFRGSVSREHITREHFIFY